MDPSTQTLCSFQGNVFTQLSAWFARLSADYFEVILSCIVMVMNEDVKDKSKSVVGNFSILY